MRTLSALLIVSTFCASLLACGTPTSVGTDSTVVSTPPTSEPVAQQGDTTTSEGGATAPSTPTSDTPSTPSTPAKGLCGTSATAITYSGQAQAVIAANCTLCHNVTSPVMSDYDTSRSGFGRGGLVAVQNGSMPISITLSDNDKCILTEWANNNYAK